MARSGPLVQPYVGRCAARPAERQAPSLDCVGADHIWPLRSVMAAAAAAAGPTSVSLSGLRAEASTDVPGSQPNGLRPAGLTKKRRRFLFGRNPPAIRLGGPPVEPQVLTTARCGLHACARGNSRRSRTAVGVLAGSRPGSRLLAAEPWLGTRYFGACRRKAAPVAPTLMWAARATPGSAVQRLPAQAMSLRSAHAFASGLGLAIVRHGPQRAAFPRPWACALARAHPRAGGPPADGHRCAWPRASACLPGSTFSGRYLLAFAALTWR